MLTSEAKAAREQTFKILFCGDLILLEDQVKNAYTGDGYDFTPLFDYTKRYIRTADFSIGVFEGPCGGTNAPYSQSNYADGVFLYLNFPDSFADAVKDAGFDLVTTATNHILDMGATGVKRTIDVLNQRNLPYTGSYINAKDKKSHRVKVIERDGIKMAMLAYSYGANYHDINALVTGELSYVSSFLVPANNPNYSRVLNGVRADFDLARRQKPDLIIVLPHWGTQFVDDPDDFQMLWRKNFLELGADIILGDHTHSVQPVKFEKIGDKVIYTVFCPGNYANIFRGYNGDATAMVEVHVDRKTKKIVGGAVIPMWVQSPRDGNYRALPIYEIVNNPALGREISTHDLVRAEFILKHITRVMMGQELDFNMIQDKFYQNVDGFIRQETAPLTITDEMMSRTFFQVLKSVRSVCFVGDSITEGTKNNGVPWYEPVARLIEGTVFNRGWGSCTTKLLRRDHIDEITSVDAELFVIAIGTNDVRYRNPDICAMDAAEYVEQLTALRKAIVDRRPDAKFVFITPWRSTDGDKISRINILDRAKLYDEYTDALKKMCATNGDVLLDPSGYIGARLQLEPRSKYMRDAIHPNAGNGVRLYSEAVMLCQ